MQLTSDDESDNESDDEQTSSQARESEVTSSYAIKLIASCLLYA